MWFFSWCPFVHDISTLISHFQFSSLNLFPIGQRCFGKFYGCWLILKSKFIRQNFFFCSTILKSKLLYLICGYKSRCWRSLFHIIGVTKRKIRSKGQFSIFIRSLFFDHSIRFQDHITFCIDNIILIAQSKYSSFQYTVRIFLFFQHFHFCFLTFVLPVRRISNFRSILVTVGQINLTGFPVKDIPICCLFLFNIIFAKRKIGQFCHTSLIRCNSCYQCILFVIILTLTIRRFNIL